MEIIDHAFKRAKERLGLNKKAFDNTLNKAIVSGIHHGRTKNKLHKWIYSILRTKKYKANTLIHGNSLLIILGGKCVSVYKVPNYCTPTNKFITKE